MSAEPKSRRTSLLLCSASYVSRQRNTARVYCRAPTVQQSIDGSPGRRAHSSKPAAAACGGRMTGQMDRQTDGRTDTRQFHRPCSEYYASNVNEDLIITQTKHAKITIRRARCCFCCDSVNQTTFIGLCQPKAGLSQHAHTNNYKENTHSQTSRSK